MGLKSLFSKKEQPKQPEMPKPAYSDPFQATYYYAARGHHLVISKNTAQKLGLIPGQKIALRMRLLKAESEV